MGWRGQKFLGKKKTFLTRKFSGKISWPKISSGNFGSDSPSRGNFEAQNFLETYEILRGNFGITKMPVAPVAQRYHVTSDTLGREFDSGKRDFSH